MFSEYNGQAFYKTTEEGKKFLQKYSELQKVLGAPFNNILENNFINKKAKVKCPNAISI